MQFRSGYKKTAIFIVTKWCQTETGSLWKGSLHLTDILCLLGVVKLKLYYILHGLNRDFCVFWTMYLCFTNSWYNILRASLLVCSSCMKICVFSFGIKCCYSNTMHTYSEFSKCCSSNTMRTYSEFGNFLLPVWGPLVLHAGCSYSIFLILLIYMW